MSKDLQDLNYLIDKQFKVIQGNISFITSTVDDIHELMDETYLMTKDTFELLLLFRALRDILEDIL